MSSKIDEVKSILLEHQRQITQLFELYERSKQTNDNRSYVLNQTFEVMKDSITEMQKDFRTTNRVISNIDRAMTAYGYKEMQARTLEIQKTVRELVNRQNTLQEYLAKQTQYIGELEKMLTRTIVLTDNSNLILQYAEQNGSKLDSLVSKLCSPDMSYHNWQVQISPGFEAVYGSLESVPPLNLAESNV